MSILAKPAAAAGTVSLGDLTVNRMGFGAMRVAGPNIWGEPNDRLAMRRLLVRAFDLGHNFFDTADSYGPHVSETLIAESLFPYPKDLVIGTKGGLLRPSRHQWERDGRPEHLRQAVDGSLKRLRLECIDLYQFHAPDPKVPFSDSIGALAELQRTGKIRHLGISSVNVHQLNEARHIAPIVSVQNKYNLENRDSDDVLAACERLGIAFIPWYPLGAGQALRSAQVRRVAARLAAAPAQVAIAWLLLRSPVMLPIPGTSSMAHLEENAAAGTVRLASEDLKVLEKL